MPLPDAIVEEIGRLSRKVEVELKDLQPIDIAAGAQRRLHLVIAVVIADVLVSYGEMVRRGFAGHRHPEPLGMRDHRDRIAR